MSDTLKSIRSVWISQRKEKSADLPSASTLSLLVSECQNIGKNDGNRDTTEKEVQAVLKKFRKSLGETLANAKDDDAKAVLEVEIRFVEGYMPQTMGEADLRNIISENCTGMNIGQIMGFLKKTHGDSVDMKMASAIAKEYI